MRGFTLKKTSNLSFCQLAWSTNQASFTRKYLCFGVARKTRATPLSLLEFKFSLMILILLLS